jgi:hypothetical protein
MLTLAVVAGVIGGVGAAGLLRDRLRGRRRPAPPDAAGANARLRHYSQVRDSEQQHGLYGGPL